MNESKYSTYTYRIQPQDLDGSRHFRLVALERMLLATASEAATERNFGAMTLIESEGVSWVLLKLAIELEKMPVGEDSLCITTWVEKVGSLLTSRNFVIRNASGDTLGYAASEWALIHLGTRRPMNLSVDTAIATYATGEAVPAALPGRIKVLEPGENTPKHTVRVSYSDIDYNGHTNSMQYLQWILDAYPIEKIYGQEIDRLEIIYAREVLYGETVDVYYKDLDGSTTLFAVKAPDGSDCVRAQIRWRNLTD